ncbi:conjugal transfer protein [Clavibacter nebraskensis]|uniref:conjugal transfer protein n=1 Tax=Clavibacter nebraskensis TaxID=31963 RepID=UPI003F4BB888
MVAVVCGPLALGAQVLGSSKPVQSAPAPIEAALSTTQQSAGGYAVGYVGAWLSATRDDSTELRAYFSGSTGTVSTTPFEYRNVAVASLAPSGAGDLVTVIVAADVKDAQLSDTKTGPTWPRRYFQVAVSTAGDRLAAVALPAPVAGPAASTDAPSVDYPTTLATSDALGGSVVSFLTAYLTGQGAVEPYTSPNAGIRPIAPAPYTALTPVSLTGVEKPDARPGDGTTESVLATVTAQNAVGQTLTASYALTLTARANRWEVSSIEPAPQLNTSSRPTPTPTPTPTGAGTSEGK